MGQPKMYGMLAVAQVWRHNADGHMITLVSERARSYRVRSTLRPVRFFEVTKSEIASDYTLVECDHDNRCCTMHETHATPHVGCLLR